MAFDVITPSSLGRGALSPTISTFHIVSQYERTILKTIDISNPTINLILATVYLVPSGGTADNSNVLIPNVPLNANTVFQWSGAQVLNDGDTIQAKASSTNISINISGGTCT